MSNKMRKEMLSAVRAHCAMKGAVWMRDNLMRPNNVAGLADLPDHALAAAYASALEAACA